MKMETEITAPVAGILHRSAQVGDTAQYGDPLGAIGQRGGRLTRLPAVG